MKKPVLLSLFFLLFSCTTMFAQIASITPNTGSRNQTLTTTISMSSGLMATSTAPFMMNDIYLQQGVTIIYCTAINWPATYDPIMMRIVYSDTGYADFTIPPNAPYGFYDLNVNTYPLNFPILNTLTNGFFVENSAATIEGSVYFDQDQDGIYDIGELPVSNQRITVAPNNNVVFTNGSGDYVYYADSGTYVIDYQPTTAFTQTSATATYTETVPPSVTGRDFGTYSAGNLYSNLTTIIMTRYRCNLDQRLIIELRNAGYLPVEHRTTVTLNNFPFVSATTPPDLINGNTLTWNTPSLGGGTAMILGDVMFCHTPAAGNFVNISVVDSIFDMSGNFLEVIRTEYNPEVRCAYDPNDKNVSPAGTLSQHFTPIDSVLTFHINFQNTGNDTAYDVFILDTLDSDLDLATFEIVSSSHDVGPQMTPAGEVRFNFINIMLPDSGVDEPASHGYVTYRIRPKAGLPDPTVITNTSHIIFDLHAPIVTNTTMNTLTALQYPHSEFSVADQSICETDCILFNNASTSGTTYEWSFAGGNPASSTLASPPAVCYTTSGSYEVSLITTNALGSDTLMQTAYISVATSPSIFTVTQSFDSLIAPQGYDSYEWYYNNVLIPDDTLYYHVATQDGDYGVVVGNSNGCQTGVNIPNVIIGISELSGPKGFVLYPNPASEKVEISYNSMTNDNAFLSIIDKLGQTVNTTELKVVSGENKFSINVEDLASGIYSLQIRTGSKMISEKLSIQK